MKLSIVIPCFNEARNIPQLLRRCRELLYTNDAEVILVDNGSTDNTAEVLKNLLPIYPGCRSVLVKENRGYGFGIISGLKTAEGNILGWTHADMQTDPQDIIFGLRLFEKFGDDIFVKGRRYGRPLMDVAFTAAMSAFETLLLKRPMWDINAQPTMFPRTFFNSWMNPPDDFSLDLYAYYQAKQNNLNVHRFPVHFGPRVYGTSHWNINWAARRRFILRTIKFSLQMKKKISK